MKASKFLQVRDEKKPAFGLRALHAKVKNSNLKGKSAGVPF